MHRQTHSRPQSDPNASAFSPQSVNRKACVCKMNGGMPVTFNTAVAATAKFSPTFAKSRVGESTPVFSVASVHVSATNGVPTQQPTDAIRSFERGITRVCRFPTPLTITSSKETPLDNSSMLINTHSNKLVAKRPKASTFPPKQHAGSGTAMIGSVGCSRKDPTVQLPTSSSNSWAVRMRFPSDMAIARTSSNISVS